MIERKITPFILKLAGYYPAVVINGPRQSGKTTLAKYLFPGLEYVNLDSDDVLFRAEHDPRGFLLDGERDMIIDEIQNCPKLLGYIKEYADKNRRNGQFILTGSNQPALGAAVAESLAGRCGIADLMPLSLEEMKMGDLECGIKDKILISGFMPRIHAEGADPGVIYRDYFRTYVERDIRQIVNLSDLFAFETFLRLLAGRTGQLMNMESLSRDAGISVPTVKKWLCALQASFIIFKLPPYFNNFGKRQTKSAKIYFTEPGLVCYLLGIEDEKALRNHPLIGSIFENMVVMEAVKYRLNRGRDPLMYFYRDTKGSVEVDLVLANGAALYPREIKSSSTYDGKMGKGLAEFCKLAPQAKNSLVVYAGSNFPNMAANYASSDIWCV